MELYYILAIKSYKFELSKKVFVQKLGNSVTKFCNVDFLAVAACVSGAVPGAPAIRANPLPKRRKPWHHLTSHMTSHTMVM